MMKIKSFNPLSSNSRIFGFEPEDRGASPCGGTNWKLIANLPFSN